MGRRSKIPGGGGEVELNYRGMGELLRSPAITSELQDRMQRVQAAVPGSELRVTNGGKRSRAKVLYGSVWEEASSGQLSRALDLAGGLRGERKRTRRPKK